MNDGEGILSEKRMGQNERSDEKTTTIFIAGEYEFPPTLTVNSTRMENVSSVLCSCNGELVRENGSKKVGGRGKSVDEK